MWRSLDVEEHCTDSHARNGSGNVGILYRPFPSRVEVECGERGGRVWEDSKVAGSAAVVIYCELCLWDIVIHYLLGLVVLRTPKATSLPTILEDRPTKMHRSLSVNDALLEVMESSSLQ